MDYHKFISGRLIALDKQPGMRPVGVRETWIRLFGTLNNPQKIGNLYSWMQKMILTRSIALELFGQFTIYGCPEIILFLIDIVTSHRSSCETGMGRAVFCTVGRE